jgi:hypothetical protein
MDKEEKMTNEMIFNTILKNPELVANIMTTRADLLQKLFDPRRDIDIECGYPKTITETQYREMYGREIGHRVVNVYPEETWKKLPEIYEDPDPEKNTPFEESLDLIKKRFHLLHYLQRADELSGIGQYGIILWGINDGKTLDKPVDGFDGWGESTGGVSATKKHPIHKLLYIRVLDASLVNISGYEQDIKNPRYGMPTMYTLTLADPRTLETGASSTPPNITRTNVHWTRVTHIADNRKTSEVFGTPRMEPVWNRLCDLRKILGGNGEMFWRGGFPGISLETQPGLENAELDIEKTRAMMSDYMNGLQRYLALTGMSAKSLAPQIVDPTASFEVQIKAICINICVPYRVFMGIEEGVVSGDQATKAWDSRIASRQQRYVSPMIIDPVIQRLIDYGVIAPTKEPCDWTIEWPDITVPGEKDKAEVAAKRTEALAKYVAGGVDAIIPLMEFLTVVCGFDEDIATSIIESAVKEEIDIESESI